MKRNQVRDLDSGRDHPRTGVPLILAILSFAVLFLLPAAPASARCCKFFGSSVGKKCCNIFACRCSGPCTNFGCACPPVRSNGVCGSCTGEATCAPSTGSCFYCRSPEYCCNNDTQCCVPSGANLGSAPIPIAGDESETPAERFAAIDRNGDHSISLQEAKRWVKENNPDSSITKADVKAAFKELDRDGNGGIEPAEFDDDLADTATTGSYPELTERKGAW